MAVSITRFSVDEENLGRLRLLQMQHDDALDGTDQIIVACYDDLQKHDRLVWQDKHGLWHEHIVDEPKRSHDDSGVPITVATCINSIAETWDDYIVDVRPSGSSELALNRILEGTRWTAGTCSQAGTASHTFYHISVREGIQELIEVWGGELETEIVVDGNRVVQRIARIVSARGNQDSTKRFTWTKDLLTISRTVGSENPKTRIYAYGRGEQTETGGFGRRIGIESVNGGIPYVEDAQATAIWGRPDGSGGKLPAIGKYENDQCEDPAQLLSEARAYLEQVKAPQVTYVADVIDLADYGRAWEEVSVGDHVAIIDKEFSDEGLRLHGRISKIERDLLEGTTVVTFGTLTDAIANPWRTMQARLASLTNRSTFWDMASVADSSWLNTLISQLNSAYNTAGTYHFSSFEKGEIWSNVPLDDEGNAISTAAESWAMNINGRGFRLASGFNPDGTWNWRTFGDGKGFTATEIITGIIRDAVGNNWWNLITGDFHLSGGTAVGDSTIASKQDLSDATSDNINDVRVEFAQGTSRTEAPTSGWSTTCPAWEAGKYIWQRIAKDHQEDPTTYSDVVCISGRDGTGVATHAIAYAASTSGTTAPSTGWQATPPSVEQGKWLWTRTTITYDDATDSVVYSVAYVGTDGEDGTSVFVQSSTKQDGTTTLVIADSDGHTTTLTIKDGTDGENGTPGTNGLSGYVHVAWATSADGSQGFSTTVSAGKTYIGVYTDHTEADSTRYQDYSWSLIKGADGTSVTVSKIEYATSTSGSTQPSSGSWSTTVPTSIDQGKWLWTRTTYSDSSTATSKSYVGTDGEDGTSVFVQSSTKQDGTTTLVIADSDGHTTTLTIKDGTDGENGTPGTNGLSGYVHVAWATSADGSQGFSTTVSAGKTYIGVYTDHTAADSTRYQDYSWSLIKGADGDDGIGIKKSIPQWYLSTSQASCTGGSWSNTQPAWQANHYLWTRTEITWSDDSVSTTPAVLAGAINSANEAAADAAKVATNYLTFSSGTGLDVGYSGTSAKTRISGSGVEIFNSSGISALFAGIQDSKSIVRVGVASGAGNIVMSSEGYVDIRYGSTILAHFGYGDGNNAFGSKTTAAYYTLGVRNADSYADIGNYSVAEALNNKASGYASHAEGNNTEASGHYSHTEGSSTKTYRNCCHAEGRNTVAGTAPGSSNMYAAHAEGSYTTATGESSHAEGYETTASGSYSHAGGYYTTATDQAQTVIGAYNVTDTQSLMNNRKLLIIGAGTSSSNRKNAFYVQGNGNVWCAGTLSQNSDRRLKEHHKYLDEDACEFIRKLRPALYTKDDERHVGFYAQDVQNAEPEGWDTVTVTAQHTDESLGFDPLTLDYTALIAPLVAYTQQLERRINELEQTLRGGEA